MATSSKPPKNAFVARARKVYNPIGFSKGYNFVLWFIFVGALFGFALARLEYLDFWGVFCNPDRQGAMGALPGECFYYTRPGRYQVGIILHLAAVVPGSLLACVQFVPVVRHKAILVHRINGYIVVLLGFVGTAAALVIARHSAGGGVDVQVLVGLLAILFIGAMTLAVINVKRLQIEQHRAWMIRAWSYGGVIITTRIGLFIGALVVSSIGGHYLAQPCDKINFAVGGQNATMELYPECAPFFSGANPDQQAVVDANYYGNNAMEVGAAFNVVFGPAAWIALALHVIGAELYLRLTPAEHDRLRNVSYQRQLEAGMKNPGRAGLTADRLGDASKWTPASGHTNVSDGEESLKNGAQELQPISNN
ncbi:hypothetical protein SAMD00023353_5000400 [Rosellinia necatrix]|uniref:Microtubule associated protein n=1 Tax=Rosellinia necatrix TaxID=77044 RepID=A0A1W2TQ48_ROSNE|nr:hypothetical protein SAMD00023353_5000400 [Rosellinia necatrix]